MLSIQDLLKVTYRAPALAFLHTSEEQESYYFCATNPVIHSSVGVWYIFIISEMLKVYIHLLTRTELHTFVPVDDMLLGCVINMNCRSL